MANSVPTLAEAKDYLNIAHTGDDGKLALMISAAVAEYQGATGKDISTNGTAEEKVGILARVANLYGFRGDDSIGPSTWFVDAVRRMNNPNAVG